MQIRRRGGRKRILGSRSPVALPQGRHLRWSLDFVLDVKSLTGRLQDELLNETLLTSLAQAQRILAAWRDDYNRARPHSSPGGTTPAE